MAELRNRVVTTPERIANRTARAVAWVGRKVGMADPDSYGRVVGQRLADAYMSTPVVGSLQASVDYAARQEYGPAAIMAGVSAASVTPISRAMVAPQALAKIALAPGGNRYVNSAVKAVARAESRREEIKRSQFAAANKHYEDAHMQSHTASEGVHGFANANNQAAAQAARAKLVSGK